MIASMMLLSGVRSSRLIFSMKPFFSRSIFPSFGVAQHWMSCEQGLERRSTSSV
jgi:hypothetical protein